MSETLLVECAPAAEGVTEAGTNWQVTPVGTIRFNGERIDGLTPHAIARKGLGYVPEDRAIFPTLTVRENLLMGAYHRRDRDRLDADFDALFGMFPRLRERRA